jgi:protein-tyrosine phosphatase
MRHVEMEACFNFRDLGGYEAADGRTTRWRTLYRSDTLHRLTDADIDVIRQLQLHTIIDLRSVTELDDHGPSRASAPDVAWHHVAMLDNIRLIPRTDAELSDALAKPLATGHGYAEIAERFAGSIAQVFGLLAAGGALPAVFHCTSGKDRTGIVAAFLLDILGVDDEVIAADYVLTERSRARSRPWIEVNEPQFAALLAQVPPELRPIRPDTILDLLTGIRAQHSSVEQFLIGAGVTAGQLESLRDALLEG